MTMSVFLVFILMLITRQFSLAYTCTCAYAYALVRTRNKSLLHAVATQYEVRKKEIEI